jgi:hypothetical protein
MTQRPGPSLPPAHLLTHDAELDRLMCPQRFYKRPANVLADGGLTIAEQRAILSSWASQACASEALPPLGAHVTSSGAHQVSFEEITEALRQLEQEALPPCLAARKSVIN